MKRDEILPIEMNDLRPNIVLIITDQQRYDTIRSLGYSYAQTPVLDQMISEGTHFTQCHITASSCAPARASLFTGLYAHNHRVLRNGSTWPNTWVSRLSEAGYYCVNIGKMHTVPYEESFGYDHRFVVENKERSRHPSLVSSNPQGPEYLDELDKAFQSKGIAKPDKEYYGAVPVDDSALGAYEWSGPSELHPDNFVADAAEAWIDQYQGREPLFLEIGLPGPHPPYDPPAEFIERYEGVDIPVQEFDQQELESQPEALKELRRSLSERFVDSFSFDVDASLTARKRQRMHYMANVTLIDERVGTILEALKRTGRLENTVVIFTSDHGDCMGDHGMPQKWSMYEAVTRVPLIIWSPGRIRAGHQVDDLFQWFDLGPTILELARISVPDEFEAISMNQALEGHDGTGRDYVYCEHARDAIMTGTNWEMMVRDPKFKLVEFFDTDEGQLFDLENDPNEICDLWDDPTHLTRRENMRKNLREWFVQSSIKGAECHLSWQDPSY